MTSITVQVVKSSERLYTLNMYCGDVYIGEYERSQRQNVEQKQREIADAADWLHEVYRNHGASQVRWDGKNKSVRVGGVEVERIPKRIGHAPS